MPLLVRSRFALLAGLLWGALAASPALAQEAAAPTAPSAPAAAPSLSVIVQNAVMRDDARRSRRTVLECDQTILTERIDESGKVIKTKTVHVVHRPTKDMVYSANLDATNEPSANATSDQDTAKAQHIMSVMNLGKLAPRFQKALVGSATIQGRDCYVIRYWPKSGQPAETREEKVINNLSGRFWVAKDNYDILQSEGSLVSPVTVALVASVTRMNFKFRSQPILNGDAGPAEFSADMGIKAPFYTFRQRQVNTLEHWRPRK